MQNLARVREIIHDVTGLAPERISLDSTVEELKISSLDMAEIVMAVEEDFDVLVVNEDSIDSIRALMNCLEEATNVA